MLNQMTFVVQLAVGLVFLLSAAGKLINPRDFARGVVEYRVLPDRVSYLAGLLLILTEVLLAAVHLTGRLLSYGALLGLVVLACFIVGVALNLKRGRILPCYCFGKSKGDVISGRTLVRLILLMAAETFLLADFAFSKANNFVNFDEVHTASELGLAFLSAIFLLLLGGWLLNVAGVVELLRPWPKDGALSSRSDSDTTQSLRH
jgi:hypothetical protein